MPLYANKTDRDNCLMLRGFITDADTLYLDVDLGVLVKVKDEPTYVFCGFVKKFEGLINIEDKTWKFSPCYVVFVLHDDKFVRRVKNKETQKYEEKEETPSIPELAFIQYIKSEVELGQHFAGEIEFSNSKIATEYLKNGEHPKIDRLFDLQKTDGCLPEDVYTFLIESVTKKGNSNNKSGYTAKSIQQVYDERLKVILDATRPYSTGCTDPVNLAFGLQTLKTDSEEVFQITMQLLAILVK